jgi:hypothetical protein
MKLKGDENEVVQLWTDLAFAFCTRILSFVGVCLVCCISLLKLYSTTSRGFLHGGF